MIISIIWVICIFWVGGDTLSGGMHLGVIFLACCEFAIEHNVIESKLD